MLLFDGVCVCVCALVCCTCVRCGNVLLCLRVCVFLFLAFVTCGVLFWLWFVGLVVCVCVAGVVLCDVL